MQALFISLSVRSREYTTASLSQHSQRRACYDVVDPMTLRLVGWSSALKALKMIGVHYFRSESY